MKEIVQGSLNELASDLLELAHLRFEADDADQHTFNALALRVQNINELIGHYFELTNESAKNAQRWKLAFQTPGVSVKLREGDGFVLLKDIVEDGKIVGSRAMASGSSIPAAVDKFLGF